MMIEIGFWLGLLIVHHIFFIMSVYVTSDKQKAEERAEFGLLVTFAIVMCAFMRFLYITLTGLFF